MLLLSIFTPWAIAEDAPPRRAALKLRSKIQRINAESYSDEADRPSDQAVQRWGQLKSRYSPVEDSEQSQVKPAKRKHVKPAPVRPIPDDAPDELIDDDLDADESWLNDELIDEPRAPVRPVRTAPAPVVEEPLPVTEIDDEPAWIYGTTAETVPLTEDDDAESRAAPAPGNAAVTRPSPIARVVVQETESEQPASDPEYSTPRVESRRPRQIHEIQPTYDLNYDRDIRDFARQQARQYQVEFGGGSFPQRMFPGLIYQWEPSNFYHYPLYFEDAVLERYGHTYPCCIQPAVSIARFSGQLLFLPYQMTLDPICTPKYALGWYRPGECAPKLHYQPPLNAKAAAVEAGVVTGLFFAIP